MLSGRGADVPTLDRMVRLMDLMAEPQHQYPVIHLTGTNGKTSTARIVAALLQAKGLTVGTFTSPHLERINERLTAGGVPVTDDELAELLSSIALLEPLLGGARLTWFEILTAAAYRWFAERPVHAAVVEVGLGGRWDATNVADGQVAVVTNIGLDHTEFLGPTRAHVAEEKAGIIKPGSILILGETDPELAPIFRDQGADAVWERDHDFGLLSNQRAVGGRLLTVRTPGAQYDNVFLALHGAHQGDNFAAALAATEAFFDAPLAPEVVAEAAATVESPGRLEVVARHPLVILDGVKNQEGARAAALAVAEEFDGGRSRILVIGMLRGHEPEEILTSLEADRASLIVVCPAPTPRTYPPEELADAARLVAPGVEVVTADSVAGAVDLARETAGEDDLILVTGSLYVVGAARAAILG
jgi:dihydrofolate synthase/folylpolyglutamate synthase